MTEELFVIDTSAILSRKLNISQKNFVIPASVLEEIKLGKMARALTWQEEDLHIAEPEKSTVEKVRSAARETGDLEELSRTDIDVIAVALEVKGTVVSDDFAIENVSSKLGISFVGADMKSISREIKWNFRCSGCGKRFSTYIRICPVCGHEVRRTVKSYKRSGNNNP